MKNIISYTTSDHNTSEQYYFGKIEEKKPKPKLIKKEKKEFCIL